MANAPRWGAPGVDGSPWITREPGALTRRNRCKMPLPSRRNRLRRMWQSTTPVLLKGRRFLAFGRALRARRSPNWRGSVVSTKPAACLGKTPVHSHGSFERHARHRHCGKSRQCAQCGQVMTLGAVRWGMSSSITKILAPPRSVNIHQLGLMQRAYGCTALETRTMASWLPNGLGTRRVHSGSSRHSPSTRNR